MCKYLLAACRCLLSSEKFVAPCVSSSQLPLEAIRLQASLRSLHPAQIYWRRNHFARVPALQTGWRVDTGDSLFGLSEGFSFAHL